MTIVLVTGAGGGLGCALVEKMLDDGFDVVCQYRDHYTALKDVWDRYTWTHPPRNFDSRCFKAELTSESDVRNLRIAIESTTGQRVQHLINLAGASSNGMCWKLDLKSFTGAIYDNLVSTFLVCREFIPGMRDAEYGRIINISSVVAANGAVGASHYAAAKAGSRDSRGQQRSSSSGRASPSMHSLWVTLIRVSSTRSHLQSRNRSKRRFRRKSLGQPSTSTAL